MSDTEDASWIDVNKHGDGEGNQIEFIDENSRKLMKVLKNVKVPVRGKRGRGGNNRIGNNSRGKKRKISPINDRSVSHQETQGEIFSEDNASQNEILIQLLSEIKGLRADIAKIDNRLNNIDAHLVAVDNRLNDLENENHQLKGKLKENDRQIKDLNYKFESVEQREKHLELIVSSPEVTSLSEAAFQGGVIQIMKDKLKLSADFLSRFSYRRIGKDGKWRALLTAQNYQDRIEIFQTTRRMKPANFYVNESLIKTREDLHYKVRQFRKNNNLNFSDYSFKGEIFIKINKTGKPMKIRDISEIAGLLGNSA